MKVKVQKSKHPDFEYEVYIPRSVYGKRIRKGFGNQADANTHKRTVDKHIQDTTIGALKDDVHLVAQRYQSILTTSQFEDALAQKAETLGRAESATLQEVGEAYIAEQKRLHKRGVVGDHHMRDVRGITPRLVKLLGYPSMQSVDQEMIEDFIDDRLDEGKSPRSVKNLISILRAIVRRAIKKGIITDNPLDDINLGTYKAPVHILNAKQITKLLKHAGHHMKVWMMFGGVWWVAEFRGSVG